jgi:hypothetical protein
MMGRTAALALLVIPLFSVPSYFLGQGIADALDNDRSDGVLALGLVLGVAVPGVMSIAVTRARGASGWLAALAVGVGSGVVAVGVLLATFVAACTATTCVV